VVDSTRGGTVEGASTGSAPLQRHKVRQPLLQQDLPPDHLQSYRKVRGRR
jgi:hypothetical protein